MSKSTNDKIDEVLEYFEWNITAQITKHPKYGDLAEARAKVKEGAMVEIKRQIQQLIKETLQECIGEKIKLPTATYQNIGDGYTDSRIGYKNGWNDLRQEALTKLEELLK